MAVANFFSAALTRWPPAALPLLAAASAGCGEVEPGGTVDASVDAAEAAYEGPQPDPCFFRYSGETACQADKACGFWCTYTDDRLPDGGWRGGCFSTSTEVDGPDAGGCRPGEELVELRCSAVDPANPPDPLGPIPHWQGDHFCIPETCFPTAGFPYDCPEAGVYPVHDN